MCLHMCVRIYCSTFFSVRIHLSIFCFSLLSCHSVQLFCLSFQIIGKSKILKYDILPYNNGRWQISFEVTSDMIPVGRVIAYYERRNEIVADSRSFKVLDICGKPEVSNSILFLL